MLLTKQIQKAPSARCKQNMSNVAEMKERLSQTIEQHIVKHCYCYYYYYY